MDHSDVSLPFWPFHEGYEGLTKMHLLEPLPPEKKKNVVLQTRQDCCSPWSYRIVDAEEVAHHFGQTQLQGHAILSNCTKAANEVK